MSFFGLFRKKTKPNSIDANDAAEVVIYDYAGVLEHRDEVVSDVESLPYPKEIIARALLMAIAKEKSSSQLEMLEGAYVALASFQKISAEARAAFKIERATLEAVRSADDASVHGIAITMETIGPILQSVRDQVIKEMAEKKLILSKMREAR